MFIKISENRWLNLTQCKNVDIQQNESRSWEIVFDSDSEISIGTFRLESEAHEVLDKIWEAYQVGKPYFEPDPRREMNVKIGDKWYAEEKPIFTYFKGLELLGLEEIEARGVTFKNRNIKNDKERPVVTKNRIKGLDQSVGERGYMLRLNSPTIMKEVLEHVASELGVDIEVTIYDD